MALSLPGQTHMEVKSESENEQTDLCTAGVNTHHKTKQYDKDVTVLGMRVRIDQLINIDTSNQRYNIAAVFDKTWPATDKDVRECGENAKTYEPERVPRIDFKNCIDMNNFRYQTWSTNNIFKIKKSAKDGKLYNCQRMKFHGNFTEEFEVANFPFDVQDLSLVFAPPTVPSKYFRFIPDMLRDECMSVDRTWCAVTDWRIVCVDVRTTEMDRVAARTAGKKKGGVNDIYPRIIFKIQVQRKWRSVFQSIVVWMFMLGLLSFCIFGYESTDIEGRLGFAITMVLTIVAFQFVISSELPRVSYLTIIDKYNYFIFGNVVLLAMESLIVGYHSEGIFGERSEKIDFKLSVVMCCLYILGHIIFVIYCRLKYLEEGRKLHKWNKLKTSILVKMSDTKFEFSHL